MTKIKFKYNTNVTVPTTSNLQNSEMAYSIGGKKFYINYNSSIYTIYSMSTEVSSDYTGYISPGALYVQRDAIVSAPMYGIIAPGPGKSLGTTIAGDNAPISGIKNDKLILKGLTRCLLDSTSLANAQVGQIVYKSSTPYYGTTDSTGKILSDKVGIITDISTTPPTIFIYKGL